MAELEEVAEFDVKVQLVRVGEEEVLYIPLPLAELEEETKFDVKVQLVRAGEEDSLYIPPP